MKLRTTLFGTTLALVFAMTASVFADNVTPATARSIAMNSTSQDSLESGARTSVWYKVQMFEGRSYQISVWTMREDGVFVNIDPVELYSDAAGTVLVAAGVTTTDSAFEGSPNDANQGPRTTIFQPTATGLYLIHAGTDTLALASTKVSIRVRETTLFSPWMSKAAGFEGFLELHNNTTAAVSVTVKAYNNAGVLQGAGLTFSIPANATVFQTGAAIGVPVGVAAGVVLTHNGAFGAISGNITTLNGTNGLSFDSPFTVRDPGGAGGSDASFAGGTNADITALTGLTTPLSVGQGGTGQSTLAANGVVYGQGTGAVATAVGVAGQVLAGTAGAPVWTGSPSLSEGLGLPATTSSIVGVINQGGSRFIHTFGSFNFFAGSGAGNFTMTGTRNTAVGYGALQSQTTTDGNTALGYFALRSNTAGVDNTAAGREALSSNSTGSNNVGVGQRALYTNTTGSSNAALGFQALNFNTTGNQNTATGHQALQANTTASDNSALGFQTLLLNTTAGRNTAIGNQALATQAFNNGGAAWDSDNTAVGYQALYANAPTTTAQGIRNTAVGASALRNSTTGRENTAIGSSALGNNTTGTANTATGTDAMRVNTTGTSNVASGYEALYTNSAGSNNVATGVQALLLNTTASKNVAIGRGALQAQAFNNGGTPWDSLNTAVGYQAMSANAPSSTGDGIQNTALGANALKGNTTGSFNTASGVGALENNTSSGNTAVGYHALQANTTGYQNTASGQNALASNTSGFSNTAFGNNAGLSATTANQNSFFGDFAGVLTTGDVNAIFGSFAGINNTIGQSNSFFGQGSGNQNSTGSRNTFIGRETGIANTTGSDNISLGFNAGYNLTTGGNNIEIGNVGVAAEDATIRIGSGGAQTRAFIAGIRGITTGVADGVPVLIDSNGQLGTISSSRRYKDDITDMGYASDRLMALRPVTFRYRRLYDDGSKPMQFGLIAEEVAESFPELVVLNKEGRPETVKYQDLTPMLLNEAQKQRRLIETQTIRIADLERQAAEIVTLKLQLAILTDRLNSLASPQRTARAASAGGETRP